MKESESESHSVMSDSLRPYGLYSPWNSLGQNTGVVSHSLLHGIFPSQGPNSGLPHCRQILYKLSYQGHSGYVPGVMTFWIRQIYGDSNKISGFQKIFKAVKWKPFTSYWDLNPCAGTQTQPKPSLGLLPM